MKVSVSGRQFVFPRSCACCGGYAATTLAISGSEKNRLSRTRGWIWEIPYCQACRTHIQRSDAVLMFGLISSAIGSVAGALVYVLTRDRTVGLVMAIAWLMLTGLGAGLAWSWLRSHRPVNCTGMLRAVSYLSSDRSCHSFDFRSGFYGAEFVRANHSKIVNASARVASILRGSSHGDFQVPRRLVNRKQRSWAPWKN